MDTARVNSCVHDNVDGRVLGRVHGRVHDPYTAMYTAAVNQAANARKKLRESKNIDVIDRLEKMVNSPEAKGLVWHKKCYAPFTDKSKLERLQKSQLRQRILNLKQAAVILLADVHCERDWSQ